MTCNRVLQDKGLPSPRTCAVCGLGPCSHVFGPATLLNVFEGVSDEELEMIVAARIAGLGKSFEGRGNLDTPDRRIKRIETALNTLARAVNHYIARVKEKA